MKKQNQSGLATVEIVLFVIIFALIGFIGWYVVKQNKDSQDLSDQTAKTSYNTVSPTDKIGTAIPLGTKFTFKELGVEITLPNSLKDIAYSKNTYSNDPSYDVYTSEFKEEANKCSDDPTANPAGFASISKHNGTYKAKTPNESTNGLLKQFDGFYFSYGDPLFGAVGCPDKVYDKLVDMQGKLIPVLQEAFGGAELVQ
jgi:hypothetical protein